MNDWTPKHFILDVDGVMTTGHFLYNETGKTHKIFGPDDADALKLLKEFLNIHFVSADKRGFPITRKRIAEDMGYPLLNLDWRQRRQWIAENCGLDDSIYMGDGIMDCFCLKSVAYAIAPASAHRLAKEASAFVTENKAGERAVADACIHILERFFTPFHELVAAKINPA